ncbi:MAG: hypothetical protein Q7S27_02405 [Nanoarchaeota archaeon]|nr:hypothetical protein [Nanoarchaeota archaeon]
MLEEKRIKIICIFAVILIGIFLIENASSIGITPGRTSVNFEPHLERDIPFSVVNNEHKNMQVVFMVQGELNESITLIDSNDDKVKDKKGSSIIEFLPSEETKNFRYNVKLPNKLEPGLHTAEVIALEIPKANEAGTFVGATVAVATQLYVYVPYPGKYLDVDVNLFDVESNSTATFVIPLLNRGKVGIGEARAVIDIYTSLNERVATIETDHFPVEPGARTELSAKWPVNVAPGNYFAKVTVFYDGETKEIEKQFAVGISLLSIESILVNDFTLGEIAKLQILIENRWNEQMKNVFANLLVYNEDKDVMADVKSAGEDIPALSRAELVAYWDTVGVQEGEYEGKLLINYNEKTADKNLLLKINSNSLDITGVGYAIRGRSGGGITLTSVLLVLIIILLVVNLAWFVFFRRFIGNKSKK